MPRLTNPTEIRALLEVDRPWAVYALGDLAPGFFEHCEWRRALGGAPAIALLYRAFEIPVLFTLGQPESISSILGEIGDERQMYLSIRPEILPLIKARHLVEHETPMWRMILNPAGYRPAKSNDAVRLGPADLPALQQLYADGAPTGEAPDFFSPSMLDQGVFFGAREGNALVAAAGTHLVAEAEGVAAVGNVYTRRDRRGRGLATRVTSAVVEDLLRLTPRLSTIALNVGQGNLAAIRVYERLGFTRYCAFCEGLAVKWS